MSEPFLILDKISYSYHTLKAETKALHNISFTLNKGEFVAIVGPSGCGKSTLLSIIFGLIKPEEGYISFPDYTACNDRPKIGYMLQRDYLFEWRSVYDNCILGLEINKQITTENELYVNQLLRDYNLYSFRNQKPSELSGGMKQRAALIRTLALNPSLLLLDEPFSALDYQTRLLVSADICNIIRKAGKTALLITHDLSEAISIADRVILLGKRPATIKLDIPIKLTRLSDSPLASRNAPEFSYYFNLLWEELANEK